MGDLNTLKKTICSTFKLSGYFCKSNLINYVSEQLQSLNQSECEAFLSSMIKNIQNQSLSKPEIEKHHIEKAFNELNRIGFDEDEPVFSVINAYDIPKFTYSKERKKFELLPKQLSIFADADAKPNYFLERYNMLLQKTNRHELFSQIEGTMDVGKKFKLLYVENLLSSSTLNGVILLGMLTQLTEGKLYIEDPTGVVPLDLSGASFQAGFFCVGSFVLVEGEYSDGVLKVAGLGFPPAETAISSRSFFGMQNTWGGLSKNSLKFSNKLQEIERTNIETTIVFLSEVRLDIPIVMEKLQQLFIGYNECPPVAIVLMGPFSKPNENTSYYRNLFTSLGDIIHNCNRLKQETQLIIVPSCEDPGSPNLLPRGPIPEYLLSGLVQKWSSVKLATNPCRLQYCTQQIVICRADLVTKFCRNTIHFPDTSQLEDHFARTLICQGTLAPIHSVAMPILWRYDAALSLYPLPDLIVVGDPNQSFNTTQHGCTILNTGSFIKTNFSFKVYVPASKTIEDSALPND